MPRREWRIGDPMINETDFWPDEAYHAEDKEKEKLVLKLATLITDRYIKKFTGRINNLDPEYWALDRLFTKEEIKFLLSFKKTRVLYSVEEIAQKNGMSVEEAQKMIDKLVWTGILEMQRVPEETG